MQILLELELCQNKFKEGHEYHKWEQAEKFGSWKRRTQPMVCDICEMQKIRGMMINKIHKKSLLNIISI